MKKYLFLLLIFIPNLIAAQINGHVQWNSNDFLFEKQNEYDRIIYGNDYSYDISMPQLPITTQSWVIPVNAKFKDITVTERNKIKLEGKYHIYPVQAPEPTNYVSLHEFTEPDPSIYNQANPYPKEKVRLVRDGIVMGYHIVTVEICPLTYIPSNKELYLSSIDYTINYTTVLEDIETNIPKQSSLRKELTKTHISSMVENPEDIESCAPYANKLKSSQRTSIIEELKPDYIIITNETLKPIFQRLADWKTKKGLPSLITTIEDISKYYRGSDIQEQIRNYLLETKNKWGEGLFILLGGDTNIVPAKMVKGDYSILRPGDLYYNSLAITWNPVSNKFENDKEKDFMFYMGRASVEDTIEANTFVEKILKYERLSSNIDYSYINNYLAVDGFIGKNESGYLYSGAMKNLDEIFSKIIAERVNRWYQFDHFSCTKNDHETHIYSKSYGEELNRHNFISALNTGGNSGLNHFHFIYHMDHSNPTAMGTSSKDKNEHITCENADNLSNGDYLQIMMSGGCEPADFSKDCIAEHLLNNPNGGVVAFIGNSDQGWAYEWSEFESFMEHIFKYSTKRAHYSLSVPFQISFSGILSNYSDWRYHLLGDPEMPIWTATPQNLNVSVTTSQEGPGNYTITVQINNLPSGQDALVCLMKGTEYYATCTIEDTLPHSFKLTSKSIGNVDVTVTAHNFRPYETTIPTNVSPQPPIVTKEVTVRDSGRSCIGNGNALLDAGETAQLSLKLFSAVERTLTNTKFRLDCSAPEIRIARNIITSNTVTLSPDILKTIGFTVKIDSLCPEKLKNELNPIRFELYMQSDDNDWEYQDAFNMDIFAPDILAGNQRIVSTSNGNLNIEANETVYFTVDLTNIGKTKIVGLTGTIKANSPYISECAVTTNDFPDIAMHETQSSISAFQLKTTANYTSGKPLSLLLTITNGFGKTWTFNIDPANRPATVQQSAISFNGHEKDIDVTWTPDASSNYNVYRSDTETGIYTKQNSLPLAIGYFKDENVIPYSIYYYKVAAINSSGNESVLSSPIKAWTVCPSLHMFPVVTSREQGLFASRSSVATYDIDNDGKQELFSTQVTWNPTKSRIIALDMNGKELFETDGNVTTYNGFAATSEEFRVTPTLADLKSNGETQLLVATREYPGSIRCYSMNNKDNNDSPVLLWSKEASAKYLHNIVVANIDNSSDGSKEIILGSCDQSGGVLILDYNGNELYNIDTIIKGYGAIAVADLDGDEDMEIIAGNDNGVYIWHHNGTPFSTNPIYTETGYHFGSSPVICDIDNDGQKEILIIGKKTANDNEMTESIVFAINTDGTLVQGWNKTQKSSFIGSWFCQDMAVGDLNGDNKLEVVVRGANNLKVWNNQGTMLLEKQNTATYSGRMNPILADIDGDGESEIIYGTEEKNESIIYALNLDGTTVKGFPLLIDRWIRNSVCVTDLDNDGKNELIAIADNAVYAWKTEGKADCIEWGTERGNSENTGEYGKSCRSTLILTNTVWDGETPCGNIMIQSGNFTIPSGTSMNLNGTSKIIVRASGTLTVDGATINNASIWAQSGSNIIIKNNGTINLRPSGSFMIDKGATLDYRQGGIMPN